MGRLQVRQSELARRLGQNDQWLSMRLRGVTPINLNELQLIADALGVAVGKLLPAGTSRSDEGENRIVTRGGRPRNAPRHVHYDTPHPIGHPTLLPTAA
jgi:transcriptional regulator with XRE-family HTH domain